MGGEPNLNDFFLQSMMRSTLMKLGMGKRAIETIWDCTHCTEDVEQILIKSDRSDFYIKIFREALYTMATDHSMRAKYLEDILGVRQKVLNDRDLTEKVGTIF